MLTSRARLSVGVFSLGVHRLTYRCEQRKLQFKREAKREVAMHHARAFWPLPVTDRYSGGLWLHTRNQMPNWLRRRWSCWSSSLLSNSMLSREWWEADRPIWRRRFSSNSRCSAWISASFSRLDARRGWERHKGLQGEGHILKERTEAALLPVYLRWSEHMLCNSEHIPDNSFHGAH